jgi:hypothetical protein
MEFHIDSPPYRCPFYHLDGQFWYLATPYSKWVGGMDDAFDHASVLAGRLLKKDVHVFSPIAHSHPIAKSGGIDPADHGIWLKLDEVFMRAAFGILVADMPGWHDSFGVKEEIRWFTKHKKPVYLLKTENLAVHRLRISPAKALLIETGQIPLDLS